MERWILRTIALVLLFVGGGVSSLAMMIAAFPLVDPEFYQPFPFRYGPGPDQVSLILATAMVGAMGIGLVLFGLRLHRVWTMTLRPAFNRIFFLPYT
jgi:hypothetical protein